MKIENCKVTKEYENIHDGSATVRRSYGMGGFDKIQESISLIRLENDEERNLFLEEINDEFVKFEVPLNTWLVILEDECNNCGGFELISYDEYLEHLLDVIQDYTGLLGMMRSVVQDDETDNLLD